MTSVQLLDYFDIPERAVVTIIGGGGKTSLLFGLARAGVDAGKTVVTTTTTKMLIPTREQSRHCVVGPDERSVLAALRRELERTDHVTIGLSRRADKLDAIPASMVDSLRAGDVVDWILVEGDGAKHRHLKAPHDDEPVVPACSDVVVPVVGIDIVGEVFSRDTIYRPERVEAMTRWRLGDEIGVEMIYDILCHEQGILRVTPSAARILPFISYVDGPEELANARRLAEMILGRRPFGIDRVALGNADPGRIHEIARA